MCRIMAEVHYIGQDSLHKIKVLGIQANACICLGIIMNSVYGNSLVQTIARSSSVQAYCLQSIFFYASLTYSNYQAVFTQSLSKSSLLHQFGVTRNWG